MVANATNSTEDDTENAQLLDDKDSCSSTKTQSTKQKIIPYLVLLSSLLSFALGAGFNFGIAGALTVAQSQRFNISLDEASWSTSVHTVCFLMTSMYTQVSKSDVRIQNAQIFFASFSA